MYVETIKDVLCNKMYTSRVFCVKHIHVNIYI